MHPYLKLTFVETFFPVINTNLIDEVVNYHHTIIPFIYFIYHTSWNNRVAKFPWSKIFAVDFCTNKTICAFHWWAVSAKINTPWKLSFAKFSKKFTWIRFTNWPLDEGQIAWGKFCSLVVARLHVRAVCETCSFGTLAFIWSWLQVSEERHRKEFVEKRERRAK